MLDHRRTHQTFSNKWTDCAVYVDLTSLPADIEITFPLSRSFPFFLFGLGWTLAAFLLFAKTSENGSLHSSDPLLSRKHHPSSELLLPFEHRDSAAAMWTGDFHRRQVCKSFQAQTANRFCRKPQALF